MTPFSDLDADLGGRFRSRPGRERIITCGTQDSTDVLNGSRGMSAHAYLVSIARGRFTGINTSKPHHLVDTILIPKRKPRAKPKHQKKQADTAPPRKPAPPKPKPKPKKPKKPALTHQERKDLGLCKCGKQAIPAQTRCPTCAENLRAYAEKRRRAQGIKPRQRINLELIEQIQKEIVTKEANQAPKRARNDVYRKNLREKQASLRAERKALGLCAKCGKPKPEDQYRCGDCAEKHRQEYRVSKARKLLAAEP